MNCWKFALLAPVVLAASAAQAAPLAVSSYSMPNGSGQASGGSFNYWDLNYTGTGSTNVDGAALSGGVGDLTDGIVASDYWFNVENGAGTGPYVGWRRAITADPLVTFNFSGLPTITGIDIQMDNSNYGGVSAPSAIWIDGVNAPFVAPSGLGTVSFTGLNLTGGSHSIQFFYGNEWIFVSEVSFFGDAGSGAVPEPASWAMMIAGFAMLGGALRSRPQLVPARA